MKKLYVELLVVTNLITFPVFAKAKIETWSCTAKKDALDHRLNMKVEGEKILNFDYSTTTNATGNASGCGVDPKKGVIPKISGNTTTFALEGSDTAVLTKNKDKIILDLTNVDGMYYCGPSVGMGAKLIIQKHKKRCVVVEQWD